MGIAYNIEVFKETIRFCNEDLTLSDSISSSIDRQEIILTDTRMDEVPENGVQTELEVVDARSIEITNDLAGKVCVLNFADSFEPGGMIHMGASTQEEAICRVTTLYPCISSEKPMELFYNPHCQHGDQFGNDDLIYTPDVVIFRNDSERMEMLPPDSWKKIDVITCAAPQLGWDSVDEGYISDLFESRFDRIIGVAATHGVDSLVLGAFGCGAFHNDPVIVSKAAKRSINKYGGHFKRIIFPIPIDNSENHKVFKKILCNR